MCTAGQEPSRRTIAVQRCLKRHDCSSEREREREREIEKFPIRIVRRGQQMQEGLPKDTAGA